MTRKFSGFYTVERETKGFTLVEMILFAAEGYYPTALDGSPNLTLARVREYLAVWPMGFVYVVNGAGSQFEVYVLASNDNYLKYDSSWGKIKVCTATQVTELGFCTDVGN